MTDMRRVPGKLYRKLEHVWLRKWYLAPRMKLTKLDVRLDLSTSTTQVKAQADVWFRPQVASARMVCLIGDVSIFSATWDDRPVRARCNPPFLVLTFPKPLPTVNEQKLTLRYTYRPDQYGTLLQPVTREDCPERVWITCRRPLLGLVQGRLEEGTENPPLRTYRWVPPRSRKLNVIVADVKSFKRDTSDGVTMWLHCHADAVARSPRLLDLLVSIYEECTASHHSKLPYKDFHVIESDDRTLPAFDSAGVVVVPRGTFAVDDRPSVYGVLAPEFNKEWNRNPTRLVSEGFAD